MKKGALLGTTLLVVGTCIGGGMLGLPLVASGSGFFPSLLLFLLAWSFMVLTGLLLGEVNLATDPNLNLVGLARRHLGIGGVIVTWLTFIFLFGSLNVAYITAGASLLAHVLSSLFSYSSAALFLTAITALAVYSGIVYLDWLNRFFVLAMVISYLLLVGVGLPHVRGDYLFYQGNEWQLSVMFPIMTLSFGYHNLIPSLCRYLKSDGLELRRVIVLGTVISLFVYLLWNFVIMGSLSAVQLLRAKEEGRQVAELFSLQSGLPQLALIVDLFSFFALVTSFFGVSLSFVDFLADGLKIGGKVGLPRLFLITLADHTVRK